MIKTVNIYCQGRPITALGTVIRSDIMGARLDVADIKKLILQKAQVREVLPDGSTVILDLNNYDKPDMMEQSKAAKEAEAAAKKQAAINAAKQKEIIDAKNKARDEAIKASKKEEFVPKKVKEQKKDKHGKVTDVKPEKSEEEKRKDAIEAARHALQENN